MKFRALSIVFFAVVLGCNADADNSELKGKVAALNDLSLQSLGISVNALAYLKDASPGTYIPRWHLENSGAFKYIEELEAAGYVEVSIVGGLPDGQQPGQQQVNIQPTALGTQLQEQLSTL